MSISRVLAGVCLLSVFGSGCASTPKAAPQKDHIAAFNAERVSEAPYKPTVSDPATAAGVSALANTVSVLYSGVCAKVEKESQLSDGRRDWIGFTNEVAAVQQGGKNYADAKSEVWGRLTDDAQKTRILNYERAVKPADFDSRRADLTETSEKLLDAGAQSLVLADALKKDEKQTGIQAALNAKALNTDIKALKNQISDATKGVALLMEINEQDKAAQAYMRDYPVE